MFEEIGETWYRLIQATVNFIERHLYPRRLRAKLCAQQYFREREKMFGKAVVMRKSDFEVLGWHLQALKSYWRLSPSSPASLSRTQERGEGEEKLQGWEGD